MNILKIESKLSPDNYVGILYRIIYRKPGVILISLLGLVLIILPALYFCDLISEAGKSPAISLVTGIVSLGFFPFAIYFQGKRDFYSDPVFNETVIYTFTDDRINLKGISFETSLDWKKIFRIGKLHSWFIFYSGKNQINFIVRNTFSEEQQLLFEKIVKLNNIL